MKVYIVYRIALSGTEPSRILNVYTSEDAANMAVIRAIRDNSDEYNTRHYTAVIKRTVKGKIE